MSLLLKSLVICACFYTIWNFKTATQNNFLGLVQRERKKETDVWIKQQEKWNQDSWRQHIFVAIPEQK